MKCTYGKIINSTIYSILGKRYKKNRITISFIFSFFPPSAIFVPLIQSETRVYNSLAARPFEGQTQLLGVSCKNEGSD